MMKRYKSHFDLAVQRTQRHALSFPLINYSNKQYLSGENFNLIVSKMQENINHSELYRNCVNVHCKAEVIIEEILKEDIYLTLGYVIDKRNNRKLFEITDKKISNLITNGLKPNETTLVIHAWLTFPSMEILDLTLPTTMAIIDGEKETLKQPIYGIEESDAIVWNGVHIIDQIEYVPMLIGEDFFTKIGAIKL